MAETSWLQLCLTPELGPVSSAELLERFGHADAILAASTAELQAAGLTTQTIHQLRTPPAEHLETALTWLAEDSHHLIHCQNEHYPPLLRATGGHPPVLFVAGDPAALSLPQLAIVGSRKATAGGLETAQQFAAHLAGAGLAITSGLALGIDTASHQGALLGGGTTIAVLGTGPDTVYPRQNAALAQQIRGQGALVTEFAPGVPPQKQNFPRRNRIISGLSLGTLVVEAGLHSGSLITARYAGEYGREVFAIPGSIHSPLSKGCHRLIRQGAKLVENSADIVDELLALTGALDSPASATAAMPETPRHKDPDYGRLLSSMGFEPVDIETLAKRSGLTSAELSSMLLILELDGWVEALPGGRFQQLTGWKKSHE